MHTISDLNYYANKIVPAMPIDDYCYVYTPFSIYLIRLEKNRVNEIQTSSAATAISDHFSSDPNKPFELSASKTERSLLNYTTYEMKLDFTTRLQPLPGNRLLICDERADWHVLALKFD